MDRHVNVIAELERRRTHRVPRQVDRSISGMVNEIERELRASQKRIGRGKAAVGEVLPPALDALCETMALRGGVLTIHTVDSAAKYRLSQWLRSGGEHEVRLRARVALHSVRVR